MVNPDQADWEGFVESEPWLEFDIWGDRWLAPDGTAARLTSRCSPRPQQGMNRLLFPAAVRGRRAVQVQVRRRSGAETTSGVRSAASANAIRIARFGSISRAAGSRQSHTVEGNCSDTADPAAPAGGSFRYVGFRERSLR